MKTLRTLCILIGAVFASSAAQAHPLAAGGGLTAGFVHPFTGLDHLLAMLLVGMIAVKAGGRSVWMIPSGFVLAMAAGSALGLYGFALQLTEFGIAASVVIFGALVAMRWKVPGAAVLLTVCSFAALHGYAHGVEMPENADAADYAAGFLFASFCLHVVGMGIGLALERLDSTRRTYQRLAGSTAALTGFALLAGTLA